MAWLLRGGSVLASLDICAPGTSRRVAPAADPDDVGACLRPSARLAHTLGVRGGIDIAWLDSELVVLRTGHLGSYGLSVASRGSRSALEAPRGAFERWGLVPGDQLEIKT